MRRRAVTTSPAHDKGFSVRLPLRYVSAPPGCTIAIFNTCVGKEALVRFLVGGRVEVYCERVAGSCYFAPLHLAAKEEANGDGK